MRYTDPKRRVRRFESREYKNKHYQEQLEPIIDPIKVLKLADRESKIKQFGFAISSHALHRYKVRFEPDIFQEGLYEKISQTEIPQYMKKSQGFGEFAISESCVAVVRDRLILTFKNPQERT